MPCAIPGTPAIPETLCHSWNPMPFLEFPAPFRGPDAILHSWDTPNSCHFWKPMPFLIDPLPFLRPPAILGIPCAIPGTHPFPIPGAPAPQLLYGGDRWRCRTLNTGGVKNGCLSSTSSLCSSWVQQGAGWREPQATHLSASCRLFTGLNAN